MKTPLSVKITLLSLVLLGASCQTPPSGELQLNPELERYKEMDKQGNNRNIEKGRPIHMPGWAYGKLTKEGDIWGGGPVYFFIGRENLDFNKFINETFSEEKNYGNSEEKPGKKVKAESEDRSNIATKAEAEDGGIENFEET